MIKASWTNVTIIGLTKDFFDNFVMGDYSHGAVLIGPADMVITMGSSDDIEIFELEDGGSEYIFKDAVGTPCKITFDSDGDSMFGVMINRGGLVYDITGITKNDDEEFNKFVDHATGFGY